MITTRALIALVVALLCAAISMTIHSVLYALRYAARVVYRLAFLAQKKTSAADEFILHNVLRRISPESYESHMRNELHRTLRERLDVHRP